jgi:hypothetical protein
MKAKDKAQEIFNKMYQVDDIMGNYPMCFDTAKSCSLIAVDEILNNCYEVMKPFWEEVKQEIENYAPTK